MIARKDGASLDFEDDDDDEDEGGKGLGFIDDDDDEECEDKKPSRRALADAADDEWEDAAKPAEDEEGDSDDDDLGGHAVLSVRTAMMNVKRAAIVALGNVAEYTDGAMAPFLKQALETLTITADYFHHEIRERSAIALQQLAHAACVAGAPHMRPPKREDAAIGQRSCAEQEQREPKAILWTKGDSTAALPPDVAQYVAECVKLLLHLLVEDTAKPVVAVACESLSELLGDIGPAALLPSLEPVLEATLALARGTSPCQTLCGGGDDEDEESSALRAQLGVEEDDDDADHDHVLMDNVADLCGAIAKVGGALLGAAVSDSIFHAFSKFVQPSRSASDRAMVIGCYAELCVELPPDLAAARHFATLAPLFSRACGDTHASVTRNAAFGLGALFSAAPQLARPQFQAALLALHPVVQKAATSPPERASADRAAADNAVAAMCRLAMADVDATPLEQVLQLVLPLLPLKEDAGENKTVFTCLLGLLRANHPALAPHAAALRKAFSDALSTKKLDDDALCAQVQDVLLRQLGGPL